RPRCRRLAPGALKVMPSRTSPNKVRWFLSDVGLPCPVVVTPFQLIIRAGPSMPAYNDSRALTGERHDCGIGDQRPPADFAVREQLHRNQVLNGADADR